MTSHCTLAEVRARHEDAAGQRLMSRTYADFSEELIHLPAGTMTRAFFMDNRGATDLQARPL
jgi:hypothetical protein